jgi:serine/threonine-protein kinase
VKASAGISDSVAGVVESETPGKCEQCGATSRLSNGFCVSCLLKEGFEVKGEDSAQVFESVLEEANVLDTQWRLGNYEILEEIGRGGMGVIYRARQRHSRRIVALKRVLTYQADSHETQARFRREAEAAASLDHPNILPIYEVSETEDGLPFFSMKFAAGGSLRSAASALRSEPRECVHLVVKVARAIAHAHTHGILHRDLQPGNILLDARGEPLVSDFGLAKWLDEESDLTQTLTTFGTPGYIAPEQAEGANFGPAADIYSLGAILFNLLAGRPPFIGANALSVIRQAAATPAPKVRSFTPSLGRDLETIVARCLERDPKARYQTAGALAEDLERWIDGRPIVARPVRAPARVWRWSRRNPILAAATTACLLLGLAVIWLLPKQFLAPPTTPAPEKSIAVLPFKPLLPENRDQVLEIGMADTLIVKLSSSREIVVRSLTSVRKYGGLEQDPLAAGRQLQVHSVLEGNVQRSGDHIRVTARLINVSDGSSLWAGTFDEKFTDVFAVQNAISQKVVDALALRLSGEEKNRLTKRYTDNVEAYQLYLIGRYHHARLIPPEIRASIGFFQQAIELDPSYALAYFGLAEANRSLAISADVPSRECLPQAKAAARKALEIDESLAEAHASLAFIITWFDWDWAGGEREAKRAVVLNPNSGLAHFSYAQVLSDLGRHEEAVGEAARARELDPVFLVVSAIEGLVLVHARRYNEAGASLEKALQLDPDFWITHLTLGKVFIAQRKYSEAIAEFEKAKELSHGNSEAIASIGYAAALSGDMTKARAVLEEMKELSNHRYIPPVAVALVHNGLGEQNEALFWLEKACEERDVRLTFLKVDPKWDSFRSNSRFAAVLKRIGLQ